MTVGSEEVDVLVMADVDAQLGELVAGHGDRLLAFAFQLTHGRASAEDVVQEALVRLLTSVRRRSVRPDDWYAYARRAVLNEHLRRERRRSAGEIVSPAVPDSADGYSFSTDLVERDRVWRALATLPARQRAVLVLRYYEAQTDAAIADTIGCRPATVRSLAARGLNALRAGALTESADGPASAEDGPASAGDGQASAGNGQAS